MRYFYITILFLAIVGCKTDSKSDKSATPDVSIMPVLSEDSKIFLGNRLFSEKTCITCHDVNTYKKGPSVVDIMTVYKEQKADIVAFLRGRSEPIVDTNPEQVAIMQDNINGFLQKITDVELDAIATYMLHVDRLHTN